MDVIKKYLRNSDNVFIKIFYQFCKTAKYLVYTYTGVLIYYVCRMFPLQDKVVATSFYGKKYGDNPQFILEKLIELNPDLDIVWMQDNEFDYNVPKTVRTIDFVHHKIRKIYEYATAKVWIDTHHLQISARKRRGQFFIETWHGGLGIKKLEGDVSELHDFMETVYHTSKLADVFISNSKHLTDIYRRAFGYRGKIWKCGYPKNDILFSAPDQARKKVREFYGLDSNTRILIYAPTFRDNNRWELDSDALLGIYNIDYERLHTALTEKMGGNWYIFLRFHPNIINTFSIERQQEEYVINATKYPDMQELVLSCDAFISDYSSCIFDAAIREVPCFTYATDADVYKEYRGIYYEMEELPFPYARNNDELEENVRKFDFNEYLNLWNAFKLRMGLHETGHAAQDIAELINAYIKGDTKVLEEIKSEP